MLAAINLGMPHVEPAQAMIVAVASSCLTAMAFALAALVRHGLAKRYLPEGAHWITLATGGCVALIPLAVYVLLLGRTETFPWVATAWLVAVGAAPFVVYPERDVD
jgi:hypothetical protein